MTQIAADGSIRIEAEAAAHLEQAAVARVYAVHSVGIAGTRGACRSEVTGVGTLADCGSPENTLERIVEVFDEVNPVSSDDVATESELRQTTGF
jgi:hypothetical protein